MLNRIMLGLFALFAVAVIAELWLGPSAFNRSFVNPCADMAGGTRGRYHEDRDCPP